MPDIIAQRFAHTGVTFVCVHDCGEDVLFTADDINGGFICFSVKCLCIFIAAVIMKISRIHVENQFVIVNGIWFQTAGRDRAVLFHLAEHFLIASSGFLEMDV